ncbi:MAG: PorV/PorQ family protein [Rubricoccaceae bacterium]|nr:PorV/PorQ family protein [Rubricoccaceae bacterium]
MHRLAPIALLWLVASPLHAQGNGLAFLALDPDPVAQGAGGAYTASTRGAFAMFFNPAGLAGESRNSIKLGFLDWIEGAQTYSAGGRFSLGEHAGAGLYVLSTSSGDLEARDVPGPSAGTFEVQYLAVGGGLARVFGPVQVGAGVKILSERVFESSASGYAVDAGIQAIPTDGVRFGASIQHLGDMNELDVEATPLPRTIRGGVSVRPFRLMEATANATLLSTALHAEVVNRSEQEEPTQFRFGAEVTLFDLLTVRGGYISGDSVRNLSAGAGLAVGSFNVDYAMLPLDTGFGTGQLISVGYSW